MTLNEATIFYVLRINDSLALFLYEATGTQKETYRHKEWYLGLSVPKCIREAIISSKHKS